jgi:hypothetical protein
VRVEGQRLIGDIEFMPGETNPTAEAVYQMVKGGFLKTGQRRASSRSSGI